MGTSTESRKELLAPKGHRSQKTCAPLIIYDSNKMGLNWNQYSIYFTALLLVLVVVLLQVMRLEEKKAVRFNELLRDLIRHNPLRGWLRR